MLLNLYGKIRKIIDAYKHDLLIKKEFEEEYNKICLDAFLNFIDKLADFTWNIILVMFFISLCLLINNEVLN